MSHRMITFIALGSALCFGSVFAQEVPAPESSESSRLKCEFKVTHSNGGKDGKDGSVTTSRCRVYANLCRRAADSDTDPAVPSLCRSELKVHCTNGFRMEDHYPSVSETRNTLWINGSDRSKIATIRIHERSDLDLDNVHDHRGMRSTLVFSNSITGRQAGYCRWLGRDDREML